MKTANKIVNENVKRFEERYWRLMVFATLFFASVSYVTKVYAAQIDVWFGVEGVSAFLFYLYISSFILLPIHMILHAVAVNKIKRKHDV